MTLAARVGFWRVTQLVAIPPAGVKLATNVSAKMELARFTAGAWTAPVTQEEPANGCLVTRRATQYVQVDDACAPLAICALFVEVCFCGHWKFAWGRLDLRWARGGPRRGRLGEFDFCGGSVQCVVDPRSCLCFLCTGPVSPRWVWFISRAALAEMTELGRVCHFEARTLLCCVREMTTASMVFVDALTVEHGNDEPEQSTLLCRVHEMTTASMVFVDALTVEHGNDEPEQSESMAAVTHSLSCGQLTFFFRRDHRAPFRSTHA